MVVEIQGQTQDKSQGKEIIATESNTGLSIADLSFQYPLRRYQQEILELIKVKLERGENKLHIVAPPGAGKTIIGLQIITQFNCPSLIVSPNTRFNSSMLIPLNCALC